MGRYAAGLHIFGRFRQLPVPGMSFINNNKHLNDWSRGEQLIFFPENLNVSRGGAEGNIEIRGKQN